MNDDLVWKYLNIAREVARLSDYTRCHTGCIIVYKRTIISSGCNSSKTHTMQQRLNSERDFDRMQYPAKLHAELSAILKLLHNKDDINWKKVNIFIYRIKKDSFGKETYGLAKPCASCKKIINMLGIRNIYYTSENGYIHEAINGKNAD